MRFDICRRGVAAFLAYILLTMCALPAAAEEAAWTAQLADLGYYPLASEAPAEEQAKLAISNFQRANSLEITGALDEGTQMLLTSGESVSKQAYLQALSSRYRDREMRLGDYGEDVYELQDKLQALDLYKGRKDAAFGQETEEAVKLFQLQVGLSPTGIADASTLYRLFEGENATREAYIEQMAVGYGDQGTEVKLLQQKLRSLKYFQGDCTGTYGSMTRQAVLLFQRCNQLTPTGEANHDTCALIYSMNCIPLSDSTEQISSIDSVVSLQRRLQALGYYRGEVTALYDVDTELSDLICALAGAEDRASDTAMEALEASRTGAREEQLIRIAGQAEDMLGSYFPTAAEESGCSGFCFVSLLYARQGIGFLSPTDIATGATAYDVGEIPSPGSIFLYKLRSDQQDAFHMGIVLTDGALALHAGSAIDCVPIESLDVSAAWVWTVG